MSQLLQGMFRRNIKEAWDAMTTLQKIAYEHSMMNNTVLEPPYSENESSDSGDGGTASSSTVLDAEDTIATPATSQGSSEIFPPQAGDWDDLIQWDQDEDEAPVGESL
jgi:hypothetical protein